MKNETNEKIARDAAEKIHWHHVKKPDAYSQEEAARTSKIILAAIERAKDIKTTEYAKGWDDHVAAVKATQPHRSEDKCKCGHSRQGHMWKGTGCAVTDCDCSEFQPASGAASRRPAAVGGTAAVATSEPQEWRDELFHSWLREQTGYDIHGEHLAWKLWVELRYMHNAAMAAEREHRKLVDAVLDNRMLQIRKLERITSATGRESKLEQQLLVVQAAIEKHNKQWNCSWAGEIKPDLSSLREHDAEVIEQDRFNRRDVLGWEQGYKCAKAEAAEVRRRLVEALVELRQHCFLQPAKAIIDAALAQVKDSPWRAKEQP